MRRRLILAAAAGVLLVAAVVLVVTLTGGGGGPAGPTADIGPTSTAPGAASSSSAVPATEGPATPSDGSTAAGQPPATSSAAASGDPAEQLPPELPAVPLDAGATVPGVVTGRLLSVQAVQATGIGVGNVSGPALRVTVQLTGDGSGPVALDGSYVELLTGPDLAPASPVDDPSVAPLQGELPAGGSATGVYVFSVDETARGDVTVRVQLAPGEPFLVFRGAAG